jgi:hypothetical protein
MKRRSFLGLAGVLGCGGAIESEEDMRSLYRRGIPLIDDFTRREAQLRSEGKLTKPAGTGAQIISPAQVGYWSGSNQFGNELPFQSSEDNRQTILKSPELGLPSMWTISLFLVNKLQVFSGFNVTANIEFGAGGSTQTIRADWVNGTQLSLVTNSVNVIAEWENVDVTTEGPGLRLGVQISKGSRPSSGIPPIITMVRGFNVLAGTTGARVTIPNFVKRIFVRPNVSSSAYIGTVFFVDTVMLRTERSTLGTTVDVIRFGDLLRGIPGLDVGGEARLAAIDNASANAVSGNMYGELAA